MKKFDQIVEKIVNEGNYTDKEFMSTLASVAPFNERVETLADVLRQLAEALIKIRTNSHGSKPVKLYKAKIGENISNLANSLVESADTIEQMEDENEVRTALNELFNSDIKSCIANISKDFTLGRNE